MLYGGGATKNMPYSSVIRSVDNENVTARSSAAAAALLHPLLLPLLCASNRDEHGSGQGTAYNGRIGAFIDYHGLHHVLRADRLGSYGAVLQVLLEGNGQRVTHDRDSTLPTQRSRKNASSKPNVVPSE